MGLEEATLMRAWSKKTDEVGGLTGGYSCWRSDAANKWPKSSL